MNTNMKKINILCVVSLMTLFGCDSILDKGPLDTFSNDNFWTSENNVNGYANKFYDNFLGYGNAGSTGDFYFRTLSDDQVGNSFSKWDPSIPASSTTWKNGWVEVRRANIMLEKIDGIASMSEAAKSHWKGFARLMRAWEYYKLTRTYGDLPWIDKALDITDDGYIYGSRESRDKVMDNVLDDLNYATSNMYENTSKITFNRAVANAMKAEICLYEGTFRKYRKAADGQPAPDAAGATKFLTASKDACTYIMGKSFKLNDSYQGNYNSTNLNTNPEMIFYKPYNAATLMHSTVAYVSSSTQHSGISKDAFDSYLFTDGKPLALTTKDKDDAAKLIDDKMSIADMLSVRDKRLSQTIDPVLCYVGRNYIRSGSLAFGSSSGYGIQKYDNITMPIDNRVNTTKNYTHAPLFWLSVIYLDYAEACAELGSITQADLDNTINKLKTRAGLPALTVAVGYDDPANNHEVSSLIWEIRRERRTELMCDNWNRYWDMVRWHQLDKLDSGKYPNILLGANVVNDPTSKVTKTGNYIDGSLGNTRTFDKKYYLDPIPSGQITLNENLKPQNPGW